MKTLENRNKLMLRLFVTILALATFSPASAQEQRRDMDSQPLCDTSIIRSTNLDTVLIYNYNGTSTFMMFTNSMTYAHTWFINDIVVNDFEVINKTVFFCGYKKVGNIRKAVYGDFPVSTFLTNPNYSYSVIDDCSELKKLDYYKIEGSMMNPYLEKHVIMTGTTDGVRSDVLADWIVYSTLLPSVPLSPYPCHLYISENKDENFDDVAVTDNYVVVSARNKMSGIPYVDLWQFALPTTIGYPIFSFPSTHLQVGSPSAETPVFLEHSEGDSYVATYKASGYSRMEMLRLTAPNTLNGSVEIFADDNETVVPIDIKYNGSADVYDILAKNRNYRTAHERRIVPMQIYHVTPDVINNLPNPGTGTRFTDQPYYLWSIDPTKSSSLFVASGEIIHLPRFFKYLHNQWAACPRYFEYIFETGLPDYSLKDDRGKEYLWYVLDKIKKEADLVKDFEFPVNCHN